MNETGNDQEMEKVKMAGEMYFESLNCKRVRVDAFNIFKFTILGIRMVLLSGHWFLGGLKPINIIYIDLTEHSTARDTTTMRSFSFKRNSEFFCVSTRP